MKNLLTNPQPSQSDYINAIVKFGSRVYEAATVTPLQKMGKLSDRLHNNIWIKREDRQPVNSFKLRGAYAMISSLSDEQKQAGVIAASAGNHAQGVALSAKQLGLKALIVMPQNTPSIKVDAVRGFGGEVLLHGANFDEAKAKAIELSKSKHMTFIPPFDHPLVIAGQGTLAMEMLQQVADLDYVFVQVGGGGLAAGVAILLKQFMPEIKVIGVESKDSACLNAALEKGEPTDLAHVALFADGVAVKRIGDETFRLCQKYLDGMVLVDSDEVCAAMKDLFENVRAIAEPSGALGLAGLKKYVKQNNLEDKNMAAILSGANLNFHTLRYVSERCEIGENREALLAVTMPEQPGSFLKFAHVIGNRAVTEFSYRYADNQKACIFVGVRSTMLLSLGAAILGMALYGIASKAILRIFLSDPSPEMVHYALQYLYTSVWFLLFLAWIFLFRNALVGLGNGLITIIGGVAELLCRFLCIHFLLQPFGFWCICLTNPITWIVACSLFCGFYFRWEHQQKHCSKSAR